LKRFRKEIFFISFSASVSSVETATFFFPELVDLVLQNRNVDACGDVPQGDKCEQTWNENVYKFTKM
jgi:hypothetical protein